MTHCFSLHAFRFLVIAPLVLLGWNSDLKAAPTQIVFDPSGNTLSQQTATPAAPTITGQPASLFAASPSFSAGFSVTVASDSPVTFQWYFQGNPIPGAAGDSLLFNEPTLANEGLYTVTVTNSLGSVTSNPSRLVIDANGNGLGDVWEMQYFGNLDQSPNADPDGDQLTNVEELTNGTNPLVRDAYYWTAASGDFDNPANWSWKRVPGLGDTAYINSGEFAINPAGAAPKVNLTVNQPYTFSPTADTTLALKGTWTLNGPVTLSSGRTLKVTSGSLTINGPATLNGASLVSLGDNTKFTVNGLTSYTQPNNTEVQWRAGEADRSNTGCELNFPNLTTITGGITTGFNSDHFVLYGRTGGTLNLPALTTISVPAKTGGGSSGVQLYGIDSGTFNAPILSSFNDASFDSGSFLVTYSGGRLLIPQLTTPYGVQLDMSAANFNLGQFVSLERTRFIRLLEGQASISVSNINFVKEIYAINNATKLSFPNVTTYTQPNNTEVQWRAGESDRANTGCELNFPNLTTITGGITSGFNSDYFVLYGRTGATLNLPALTTITVPAKTGAGNSGVKLHAIEGGTLSAPLLSGFNDSSPHSSSFLIAYSGGNLLIPQLTAPYGVQLDMGAENFNLGQFVSLERTRFIRLLGGQASINIPNVDYVKEIYVINNGTKLSFPNVTSYTQPNNTEVQWRAGEANRTNTGCELNFPSLTTITGGITTGFNSDYFVLYGRTGAALNLPVLTTITVPAKTGAGDSGVLLYAIDSGKLHAARLSSFTDASNSFSSRIEASAASTYRFTSLRKEGLQGVILSGVTLLTGPVNLQPPMINSAPSAAALEGADFTYQISGTNSPTSFSAAPLPDGIVLNASTGVISGISTFAGVFNIQIAASNPDGSGTGQLVLTVSEPSLGQFLEIAGVPVAQRGPLDDPDNDGSANLIEYALGMSPMAPGTTGLPTAQVSGGELRFTYTKRRSGLVYVVETSTGLGTSGWTSAGVNQGVPDSNNRVTASVPITSNRRFLRLAVSEAP